MKVLVLNAGSSSIKFELFTMPEETVSVRGLLQRIGEPDPELSWTDGERHAQRVAAADHAEGLALILEALDGGSPVDAVGHRVVHGGEDFADTVAITDEVERALERHSQLAPLHNPPNLLGIRVARKLLPGVPQVAVFDTAFHQTMPRHAFLYAVPYELYTDLGVRRYGFHGTSHRYVSERAAALLGRPLAETNSITCHLGNGASITAVRGGRSVDTSMGMTPLEGLVMGTRSGDLDPAILPTLGRLRGLSLPELDTLLNKRSGLLGLSGRSNDMRALLAAETDGDERAAIALDVYAYRVRKYIGAYLAVLGTVHTVVFTAGVGENAPAVRARILDGLGPLGLELDGEKNGAARGESDIATTGSATRIFVIPTREELVIARDTWRVAAG
ncbi:MAG: acetate kinase [Myxococcales bacterium]